MIFILLLFLSSNSFGQQSTNSVIDSLLKKGYQDEMFPGVGLALFEHDSTQFFSYGYAKIESKVPVSQQTKFQLGSIGKLITAISVLQLVDQGKLDMKTDINEYLKIPRLDLGKKDNPITLHGLLTHSSGFNETNIGYMA